jgi:TP901 family phage tail tape measure protein
MATDEFKIDLTVDTKQAEKSIDKVDKKLKDSTKNSPDYKPDIDTSKVETKLDKLKKSVGGFSLDSILGGLSAGGGFAIATKGFDLLSGAVTGAFNSYKEFDSAIQNIATLGVVDDLDGLKNVLNEVSKTTVDDASVLAAATYQALSAGVKGSNEELGKFAQTASKVATAGGSDAETAVDALTTVMNAFKISTDEADTVSDQFFGTIKAGKTTFPELAGSLSNVASIASTAGVKFGEVGGSIAQLTALGTPTSVATNQLKSLLTELIAPGDKTAKTFKSLGFDVKELAQRLKDPVSEGGGLVNVMNDIEKASSATGQTLFDVFSSSEAASAGLALSGDNAASALANVDAVLNKSAGSAEFAYKEASKSIENQLGLIKGSIQAFFNDIFTFIQPAVSALLTGVSTAFDFLVSVLGGAVGFVKEFGNTLFTILQNIASSPFGSLISSIFTTVKDAILSVIPTIDQIETGFASFKQTISDFSPIIAGVVTSLAAYGVYTNLALIKTTALNVITKSIAVAQGAYNTVLAFGSGVVTAITTAYSFLSSGQVIATAKTYLFSAAQAALNVIMNLNPIGLVVTAIGALVAGLIYAYKTSEDFRKILNNLYEKAIKPLIDALAEGATSVLKFFGLLSDEPDTKAIDKSTKKVEKAKKEVEGLNDELDKVKPPKGIVTPVQAKTLSEYIEQLAKLKVAGKDNTKEFENVASKAQKLSKEEKALAEATEQVKKQFGLGKDEASKFGSVLEKLKNESNQLNLSLSQINGGAVVGNLEGVIDALDTKLNDIKKRRTRRT